MNPSYNLEIDRLVHEIVGRRARRILIQVPDGLKPQAVSLSNIIESRTSAETFLSSSACYGACDIASEQARLLHADLIVHYGHTQFTPADNIPIIFLDARSDQDLAPLLKEAADEVARWKRVGVATTVQHLDVLKTIKDQLTARGIHAAIAPKGGHNIHDGQIIGCDYTPLKIIANEVESFLIIGSKFHGLGASLAVSKPVVLADPYSNRVTDMSKERERIILRRYAAIDQAKEARNFGIILGTKIGQYNPAGAAAVKAQLSARGRIVCTIVADEVAPDLLLDFEEVQVFVNTACPRLSLDDADRFVKPVLSPREALVAIGEMEWKNLLEQGFL